MLLAVQVEMVQRLVREEPAERGLLLVGLLLQQPQEQVEAVELLEVATQLLALLHQLQHTEQQVDQGELGALEVVVLEEAVEQETQIKEF